MGCVTLHPYSVFECLIRERLTAVTCRGRALQFLVLPEPFCDRDYLC